MHAERRPDGPALPDPVPEPFVDSSGSGDVFSDGPTADWDEADLPPIEDLDPHTIEGVASRLQSARSFADRVYRESEIDALWTLADMALEDVRNSRAAVASRPDSHGPTDQDLVALSTIIFEAHDLNAEGQSEEASRLLMKAADLCRSWSSL